MSQFFKKPKYPWEKKYDEARTFTIQIDTFSGELYFKNGFGEKKMVADDLLEIAKKHNDDSFVFVAGFYSASLDNSRLEIISTEKM